MRAVSGAVPWGPPTQPPPPGSAEAVAVGGTQQSAMQIAAVYGTVGLLSSSTATLPVKLLDAPELQNARELEPSPLLINPFQEITRLEWMVQFTSSLALRGNFVGHVVDRDRLLFPTQIKPIAMENVRVRRTSSGDIEYRLYGKKVPIDDIFHVKLLSTPEMLVGVNPIEALRVTFALANEQVRYGEKWFRDSAIPSGVIEVPGKPTPEETERLARNFASKHQGIAKSHLPAVVTDGAKFQPVRITPEDSQFLQSRGFTAGEIAGMIFRVPPHMVGIVDRTTSWGVGIMQQELGYVRNTLVDYIGRFQDAMTAIHPPGQYVRLDLRHRTRGDTLQMAQTAALLVAAGVINADEARAMFFDMPEAPNGLGKHFVMPVNSELLERALEEVKAVEAAQNAPPQQLPAGDPNQP